MEGGAGADSAARSHAGRLFFAARPAVARAGPVRDGPPRSPPAGAVRPPLRLRLRRFFSRFFARLEGLRLSSIRTARDFSAPPWAPPRPNPRACPTRD
jgi:hypothetical protein